MHRFVRTLVALALLLAPAGVFAQDSATIAGTVRDASGAVLPGVTVGWREYGLRLPAHYPLRFVDDIAGSDLLGPLAAARIVPGVIGDGLLHVDSGYDDPFVGGRGPRHAGGAGCDNPRIPVDPDSALG